MSLLPTTISALLNQRYRWCRGTIQVLRKYFRRAWKRPHMLHFPLVAWISAGYLLELVMLPVIYGSSFGLIAFALSTGSNGASLLMAFVAVVILNSLATLLFAAMHRDRLNLLAVVPLYDIYHGLLLCSCWFISVLDEVRGTNMRWS